MHTYRRLRRRPRGHGRRQSSGQGQPNASQGEPLKKRREEKRREEHKNKKEKKRRREEEKKRRREEDALQIGE